MEFLKKDAVTPDVIAEWKKKYDSVFAFTAKDESGLKAWFRGPTRKEIDAANSTRNPLESNEILAKACILGGDMEVITVQKYFIGLSATLSKIIAKVEGEMEEL